MNTAEDLQRELAEFQHLREVKRLHSSKQLRIINDEALAATEDLVRSEVRLIRALQAVDRLLVHRFLGYGSLFTYATGALKLSRAQGYAYVAIAKKSREFPKLLAAIECGDVSVSKAARLISVISEANQDQWLELAKSVSKRELERAIAEVRPESEGFESTEYLNGSRLRLKLAVSEDLLTRLERARDVECQRQSKCLKFEDLLEVMVAEYLDQHDPVRRADRAAARAAGRDAGRATVRRGGTGASRAVVRDGDGACRGTAVDGGVRGRVQGRKPDSPKPFSHPVTKADELSEFLPGQTNSAQEAQCLFTHDVSKSSDLVTSCTRNDSGARAMAADGQVDVVRAKPTCLPGQTPGLKDALDSSTHMALEAEISDPTRMTPTIESNDPAHVTPTTELEAPNCKAPTAVSTGAPANHPRTPSQTRRRSPLSTHVKHAVPAPAPRPDRSARNARAKIRVSAPGPNGKAAQAVPLCVGGGVGPAAVPATGPAAFLPIAGGGVSDAPPPIRFG